MNKSLVETAAMILEENIQTKNYVDLNEAGIKPTDKALKKKRKEYRSKSKSAWSDYQGFTAYGQPDSARDGANKRREIYLQTGKKLGKIQDRMKSRGLNEGRKGATGPRQRGDQFGVGQSAPNDHIENNTFLKALARRLARAMQRNRRIKMPTKNALGRMIGESIVEILEEAQIASWIAENYDSYIEEYGTLAGNKRLVEDVWTSHGNRLIDIAEIAINMGPIHAAGRIGRRDRTSSFPKSKPLSPEEKAAKVKTAQEWKVKQAFDALKPSAATNARDVSHIVQVSDKLKKLRDRHGYGTSEYKKEVEKLSRKYGADAVKHVPAKKARPDMQFEEHELNERSEKEKSLLQALRNAQRSGNKVEANRLRKQLDMIDRGQVKNPYLRVERE